MGRAGQEGGGEQDTFVQVGEAAWRLATTDPDRPFSSLPSPSPSCRVVWCLWQDAATAADWGRAVMFSPAASLGGFQLCCRVYDLEWSEWCSPVDVASLKVRLVPGVT